MKRCGLHGQSLNFPLLQPLPPFVKSGSEEIRVTKLFLEGQLPRSDCQLVLLSKKSVKDWVSGSLDRMQEKNID